MNPRVPHPRREAPATVASLRRLRITPALAAMCALALALNGVASQAADPQAAQAKTANGKTASARKPPGTTPADAASRPASETSAAETTLNATRIPQSVFLLSSPTQTLKDPFFPNSTRLSAAAAAKSPGAKKDAPAVELTLKALFGTPSRPFATINSTTLGLGEEQDVLTTAGRVRVRCLEINLAAQSVVIEVGGSRRELRFATPK